MGKRLVAPPGRPDCYVGADWYALETVPGTSASICVLAQDWPLLAMSVPSDANCCENRVPVNGTLVVDRMFVMIDGQSNQARPARKAAPLAPPPPPSTET